MNRFPIGDGIAHLLKLLDRKSIAAGHGARLPIWSKVAIIDFFVGLNAQIQRSPILIYEGVVRDGEKMKGFYTGNICILGIINCNARCVCQALL
jgi:hypothetical protein